MHSQTKDNEEAKMKSIADLLSMSIGLFYVLPFIAYLITEKYDHLRIWGGFVGVTLLSEAIKHFLIGDAGPRPAGARDCNFWCNNGDQSGRPGMPSSHSAEAMFLAMSYGTGYGGIPRWTRISVWIYAIAVMAARWYKRCHSIAQIGAGALLGTLVALLVCGMNARV